MPLIIEDLTTTLEFHDDVAVRKMVRAEIERFMRQERARRLTAEPPVVDPADPIGGGIADEG